MSERTSVTLTDENGKERTLTLIDFENEWTGRQQREASRLLHSIFEVVKGATSCETNESQIQLAINMLDSDVVDKAMGLIFVEDAFDKRKCAEIAELMLDAKQSIRNEAFHRFFSFAVSSTKSAFHIS